MDNLNLKNIQLAYGAVYDQQLCESMEDLGFFDEVDEDLDEGYKKLPVGNMMRQAARKPVKAAARMEKSGPSSLGVMVAGEPNWMIKRALKQATKMARVAERHSTSAMGKGRIRGEGQAELNRIRGEAKNEEYDLYDLVLEYLLDEGYTDSLEGAEAIMANMSNDWIEYIIEARDGYGGDEKFNKPDDKIQKPGTEVPAPKKGGYGRIFRNVPYGIGAHANRVQSRVTSTIGDDPSEPRAKKMAQENKPKPRRVIPSRVDRKPKG